MLPRPAGLIEIMLPSGVTLRVDADVDAAAMIEGGRCSGVRGSGHQSSMISRRVRSIAAMSFGRRPSLRAVARSANSRGARR